MNCEQVEILLCDAVDGTLSAADRTLLDQHLAGCPACAELARDVTGAASFLERVAVVEPPAELVTRIVFETHSGRHGRLGHRISGPLQWLRRLMEPVLQPKAAMGMALTVLSLAMVGRVAGIQTRQFTAADLQPTRVWASVDDRVHRSWDRAVKYYESLRLVYEIQSRVSEWKSQQEQDPAAGIAPAGPVPAGRESSGSPPPADASNQPR